MKKFITIIFATIVATVAFSINVNAQNGQWKIDYRKADELKGTPAFCTNVYAEPYNGGYNVFGVAHMDGETIVTISTTKGIFNCHDNQVSVLIGFYKGDKLVEKVTTDFTVYGNPNTLLTRGYNTNGTPCLGEKILNHIKNVGDVRIIVSKYNSDDDFDLTIPMNPNVKLVK